MCVQELSYWVSCEYISMIFHCSSFLYKVALLSMAGVPVEASDPLNEFALLQRGFHLALEGVRALKC